MYGQLKSTHPEGCPQYGEVIRLAHERPNHASLFCQRINKDVKKASDTSFPAKGNRNNKRDCEYNGEKSNKKRKYKSEDSDSSEEKEDKRKRNREQKLNLSQKVYFIHSVCRDHKSLPVIIVLNLQSVRLMSDKIQFMHGLTGPVHKYIFMHSSKNYTLDFFTIHA